MSCDQDHKKLQALGHDTCWTCGKSLIPVLKPIPEEPTPPPSNERPTLYITYSRAELSEKLTQWMIELWGDSPKNLAPELRDRWHQQEGLIHHFIRDHFPTE